MKICATSFLLKNVLLHEKKPDIGNGVEHSAQIFCAECSTEEPSTQYFRSIIQRNYHQSGATAKSPFLKARYCLAMSQNLEDTPYPHAPTSKRVHLLLSSGVSFRGSRKRAKATGTQR